MKLNLVIHGEENTKEITGIKESVYVIEIPNDLHLSFKFNFLTKYPSFILNSFVEEWIPSSRCFTSYLKYLHPYCIRYANSYLDFYSSLYIWYNPASHVVIRTSNWDHEIPLNLNPCIPGSLTSLGLLLLYIANYLLTDIIPNDKTDSCKKFCS